MDKWKDIELCKMKVGGNQRAREFFDSQADWNWKAPLSERYNSKAAALYRDKIATEAAGKDWSLEKSSANDYVSSTIPRSQTASTTTAKTNKKSQVASKSAWDEGDWTSSYQSGASANSSGSLTSDDISRAKDNFFSRVTNENASRPDNLPPSQGGRYTGFGNTVNNSMPRSQSEFDFAWNSLSAGFSSIASLASKASESAVKIGSIAGAKATEIAGTVNEKVSITACLLKLILFCLIISLFVLLLFSFIYHLFFVCLAPSSSPG